MEHFVHFYSLTHRYNVSITQPSSGIILLNLGICAVTPTKPTFKKKKQKKVKIEEWLSCSSSTSKYSTQQKVCFPSFFLQHKHRWSTVILAGLWRWLQTLQSSGPIIRSTGCWLDLSLLEKESKRQRVGERMLGTLWWLQSYCNAVQQRVKASQDVFQNQNYILFHQFCCIIPLSRSVWFVLKSLRHTHT